MTDPEIDAAIRRYLAGGRRPRSFWDFIHDLGPGWPDARGWIGLSVFTMTVAVLLLMAFIPGLRGDEFFKTIAALIVGAFIKDVVGWAYSATKGGGDLAEKNADIVAKKMAASPPETEEPK